MASDGPRPPLAAAAPPAEPDPPSGSGEGVPPSLLVPDAIPPSLEGGDRGWFQRRAGAPAVAARPGRLDLGDAVHDGWLAFCRAPRVFAAYSLLVNLLLLLLQPLLARIGSVARPSQDLRDWGLYGLALALLAALSLWGSLGLGRGALIALRGGRPTLGQLLRWDGGAWLRLLRTWLRLAAMVALPCGMALLLFGLPLLLLAEPELQGLLGPEPTRLLALLLAALLLLTLALTLVGVLYLVVNQAFMLQIVLVERCGGTAAVARGQQLVDPQWPLVLLLVIIGVLLNGLGLLLCAVGSLVAWPVVVCISTAAYRQLRASEEGRDPGVAVPAAVVDLPS